MITAATLGSWGHSATDQLKQIAVRIPNDTFAALRARAINERCSMNKKILQYIMAGLEVDDEWDLDEPNRRLSK